MGQPGKVQTTLLTPVDVVKADWLSKGVNRTPEMLAIKPPRPKIVEIPKDVPEYIIDPGTKTTYLKGKFLGKGGFARVHELTDLTTNQVYAGKIIPKSRLTKPHQKEKILREIDLHRQLQHKNVVRFHHFFEDEHNVYIILENCSRKSLVHILKNRKYLTEPEVRYFMLQLAEGVRYTHSQGVIHRDLKLGNMFLSEEMEVKIGDFGLATHISNTEKCGRKFTVCGTPNYIAPEVLNMQGHSFAADVWAMGCIMYAMLVGQPPFETTTLNETYYRISTNKYTIPSSMSDAARHLVAKMLQLKPTDRPSLEEIIQHKFFVAGFLPSSLPTSCCIAVPKFPLASFVKRSSSEQDVDKIAGCIVDLHLSPKPGVPKIPVKSEESSPKKDNCFPTNIRQKLTSVLCPDKIVKKPKEVCNSASMYDMITDALESIPEDCDSNPPPLSSNLCPFITKWIDYSNKYGFGFQLSDHSIGVIFNDSTRMSMSSNKGRVEFHDNNGKLSTYSHSSVPSQLLERFTLLKYFAQYMDENLTEGGELQSKDLVRKKIPFMKRWLRSSNAIIMQLSSGTLQINFFKDHTKIVIGGDGTVMYIDEDRHSSTYALSALCQHGCSPSIRSRLQYAASVLQDFAQLEGDSA
ncbi:serine/threonine-protein kinase PLK1-like [Uloborus diversus]|uniref:serine/threonine-protein kinase PLK1-like n=1 Tax=Uloborus diversus TaxID=327109 RepID=UPI00240A851D|nr:serine/threonine-protein kinase PLK1-like [Uloborus diversus]